ncbi:MAG: hypothetical protein H0T78_11545 [Longispora sp.]|nr:hypothetical protein [Longispora sp. (in: high G+C Gram-positive bacteria)]
MVLPNSGAGNSNQGKGWRVVGGGKVTGWREGHRVAGRSPGGGKVSGWRLRPAARRPPPRRSA